MEQQPKDTSNAHFWISMNKSVIRIVAGAFLINGDLLVSGSLFILAELLGIAEEMF